MSIPVAIGIGISVSVVAGVSNLGLIAYGVSLGRKDVHEKQNENNNASTEMSTIRDLIRTEAEKNRVVIQEQHGEQMRAIRQTNSAINTHAEKTDLLLTSVDSKLDYHLDKMHESKKHQQEEGATGQPDATKVKVSDALVKLGIHASANKENIEPEVADKTDEVKP